ncbi:olfactory receptor 8H1-like [Ruditapes philippinarum]|uniref:olfactory receptor 8H1-like n=1 Tax=Ruditapes philippinarum TaxID=129788 RepID=UPI00295C28FF|nr:olfactory receptor 8H1-like [Ruditapes philippinarum]
MDNSTIKSITMRNNTRENITLRQNTMANKDILTTIQWEIAERLVPATVILYVLVIIGIFGNIMAIVFYMRSSKRTPPTLLITCMAAADLGTCLAGIPVISEMIVNVNYSLAIACKLTHFFGLWAGASACFVLWLISIDRYRKICYPLAKQMTISTVKYLVVGVTSFALLLAIRFLVTFDSVEVNVMVHDDNTTVKGLYCTTSDDYKLIALVFYAIDFLFILMIWITVVVTYSKIIYTIITRRVFLTKSLPPEQNSRTVSKSRSSKIDGEVNFSKKSENANTGVNPTRNLSDVELDDMSISEMKTDVTEVYTVTISTDEQTDKQSNNRSTKFDYSSIRKPSEVKLTLMVFAVTMIFILCFTPYFAIRIFIRIVLDSGNEYDFNAGLQFALKLPYINSALNPVIYYIFNPNFRRYIFACLGKCRSC